MKGVPDAHDLDRLSRGISLEGRRTAPARVEVTKVIDADSGRVAATRVTDKLGRYECHSKQKASSPLIPRQAEGVRIGDKRVNYRGNQYQSSHYA